MKKLHSFFSIKFFFIFLAFFAFVLNMIPTFQIGFYQDDYKSYFDLCQNIGWDFLSTLHTNQLHAGFRPFDLFEPIILYQTFGENVILFRFFLCAVHLIFGILLFLSVKKITKNDLAASFTLFIYFASVFTRQTIYSIVAQSPSDLIICFVVYYMVSAILDNNLSLAKIGIIAFLYSVGLGCKENAFALSCLIPFITLIYYTQIEKKKFWILNIGTVIITLLYLIFYFEGTADATRTTIQTSPFSISNLINVVTGVFYSSFAPFINLFNLSRGIYSISMPITLSILGIALLFISGFVCFSKAGRQVLFEKWKYFLKLIGITFIANSIILAIYIFNPYFEPRMMIVSYWLGTLCWGIIFSEFLEKAIIHFLYNKFSTLLYMFGLSILILPSIGAPISQHIKDEYRSTNEFKQIVNCLIDNGSDTILLKDFSSQSNYLRGGNASGIIRYLSNRKVTTLHYTDSTKIKLNYNNYPIIRYTGDINQFYELNSELNCY